MGEQRREGCDDALGLNIWWNLNRLREHYREVDILIKFFCLRRDYPELMHPRKVLGSHWGSDGVCRGVLYLVKNDIARSNDVHTG